MAAAGSGGRRDGARGDHGGRGSRCRSRTGPVAAWRDRHAPTRVHDGAPGRIGKRSLQKPRGRAINGRALCGGLRLRARGYSAQHHAEHHGSPGSEMSSACPERVKRVERVIVGLRYAGLVWPNRLQSPATRPQASASQAEEDTYGVRARRQRHAAYHRRGPADAAAVGDPRSGRAHRHEVQLRHRTVRRVHAARRWPRRQVLQCPGGLGHRQAGDDHRGTLARRQSSHCRRPQPSASP